MKKVRSPEGANSALLLFFAEAGFDDLGFGALIAGLGEEFGKHR